MYPDTGREDQQISGGGGGRRQKQTTKSARAPPLPLKGKSSPESP